MARLGSVDHCSKSLSESTFRPHDLFVGLTDDTSVDFKFMARRLIWIYFGLLCLMAPFNLLAFDTYYYWDWSRHLDWSYFDGPPLVAYLIRMMSFLFGHAVYGLAFTAILCTALTARVLFKTARLLLDEPSCYIVTLLWLTSPLITQDLLVQLTYDTPMMLLWSCVVHDALRYLQTH